MVLSVPSLKSLVKGINIFGELLDGKLAENSPKVVDEYIRICITSDGSNQAYCNKFWECCFTEAIVEGVIVLKTDPECTYFAHCFRKNENFLEIKVIEGKTTEGHIGLFLHVLTKFKHKNQANLLPLMLTQVLN